MSEYKKQPSKALIKQQLEYANEELEYYKISYPLRCTELEANDKRIAELEAENVKLWDFVKQVTHTIEKDFDLLKMDAYQLLVEPTTADDLEEKS